MSEQLKRTPLYQKHLALGAKMVPFAGWEMPVSYPSGIIAEHTAVRNSVGVFDIGHMGLIKVQVARGKGQEEGLDLIQKLTTNDASKLAVNQCQYSVLCNENGGALDDLLVYRFADHYMIIANASNADKVLARLRSFPSATKVSPWEDHAMLSIQGPQAVRLVEKALAVSLSNLKRNHTLEEKNLIFSRTGYTGEDGIELIIDKIEAPKIWDLFIEAKIQPCGLGARDTLRLEAGLPLYGHEYDEETTPLEAGYPWAVKFDKGDFSGRAALLKEKEGGLKKQLVGIELEGRAIPRQGNSILDIRNSILGVVTSGTFSPTFKKPVALAYLLAPCPLSLASVFVEIRGERVPGRVVDKSLYKRVK
ncbi:MAG: glycine cleavage system aminomethyltransferase GcvT [Candidatus Margulisbacteria bacterium]|nr:glycine cleavage system aminomethyltransferase GcvT [Candidatus Margulisiibacteriota bacterium]